MSNRQTSTKYMLSKRLNQLKSNRDRNRVFAQQTNGLIVRLKEYTKMSQSLDGMLMMCTSVDGEFVDRLIFSRYLQHCAAEIFLSQSVSIPENVRASSVVHCSFIGRLIGCAALVCLLEWFPPISNWFWPAQFARHIQINDNPKDIQTDNDPPFRMFRIWKKPNLIKYIFLNPRGNRANRLLVEEMVGVVYDRLTNSMT